MFNGFFVFLLWVTSSGSAKLSRSGEEMIIIPKEKPVVEKLNSYYLKLDRLLEHYRGELDSGCIYFYAPVA